MANINKHERAILQTLHRERRAMTINEIVKETGISWVTTKKYIELLNKKKYVLKEVENKRPRWHINYTLLE